MSCCELYLAGRRSQVSYGVDQHARHIMPTKFYLTLFLLACSCLSASEEAENLGPHSASANFSADLYGPVDTRLSCWGNAEAWIFQIAFRPPEGYRVRVLRLRGDLVSWPRVLKGEPPVATGSYAGVLLSFHSTGPDASERCDYCAENHMIYVQDALSDKPVRTPYDMDTRIGGLLSADHKLNITVASWLNTTGYPIHIEPTFTVEYQYEPTDAATGAKRLSRAGFVPEPPRVVNGGRSATLPVRRPATR